MRNATVKCCACGWWDLSMKYGSNTRCTRCGTDLYAVANADVWGVYDKTPCVRVSQADDFGIKEED